MTDLPKVKIPANAVLATGDDVLQPVSDLLQSLDLKGSDDETKDAGKPSAIMGGPAQSVALIEAGATAVSKWWATGLGATVIAAWSTIFGWWGKQGDPIKEVALWAAAIITAAAVLGIAYLLGSDVRGRSAASIATIQARSRVANSFVQASQAAFKPSPPAPSAEIVALPAPLQVINSEKVGDDERDWCAIALSSNGDNITKYLLVKKGMHEWVDAPKVLLSSAAPMQVQVLPTTSPPGTYHHD